MKHSLSKATMPGGFFITGTDTDVGKTYAAGCIAHTLIQDGYQVTPRKPIASGCIPQADGSLWSEDAGFLQTACQTKEPLSTICPHQFEPAISPQTAIEQAGHFISTQTLVEGCKPPNPIPNKHVYLVEGAGGFYSPLCSDGLNKDLAIELNLPVILVVKNQLGCINHTLLTLEAIKQAGLKTHAIILNFSTETNHATGLESWTNVPILTLPFTPNVALQSLTELVQLYSLPDSKTGKT